MPNYIDVVILVDTDRLIRDYPLGWTRYNATALDSYFETLVSPRFSYADSDDSEHQGIRCNVRDTITMSASSKADQGKFVIINQFADYNRDASGTSIQGYLSPPEFLTATYAARTYSDGLVHHFSWNGWDTANKATQEAGNRHQDFVQMTALQSTRNLSGNHIQYTLGFQIFSNGAWRSYHYDPFIRIEET